ncbi:MAG: Aspartyl/asparaginyl beta-hydroxylase [Acidobacteria bacterium]|nr:Aspartyl/asparaginyl beta-hydroxylase [Acidobacteriota bacterium]
MISILKLPFVFDPHLLKEDLGKFAPGEWIPHFNKHYYEGDWSGIAFRAAKGAAVSLYPDPVAENGYVDTENLARCSYISEVLSAFKCELESARFLRLGAGASIREHRDYQLGYEDGVVRIHIPVQTNRNVKFVLDGQSVDMKEGEAWYLNFNLKHSVVNSGETDRVHLVVDCVLNDWLRGFFLLS